MRQEYRHHTDEQIREALAFALGVVDELGLTDELRSVAFSVAVNLRTAKSITEVVPQPLGVPAMSIPQGR